MQKYFKIWWRLLSINWQVEMMYKINYILFNISEFIYNAVYLVYIYFLFRSSGWSTIAGMSIYDFYLVYIVFELVMTFAIVTVYSNSGRLKNKIFTGEIDLILVKPKANFLIHNQRSWMAGIFQRIIIYLIIFLLIYQNTSLEWNLVNILLVCLIFIYSYLILYFIYWSSVYLFFYFPKFDVLYSFIRTVDRIGENPAKIFPRGIQWIFTFILPFFW